MAVDTKSKRLSVLNLSSGVSLLVLPDPDATIDGGDQQHLLDCYSGIAFGAAVAPPLDPDDLFTARRIIGATLNPKSDIKIIKVSSGNR